MGRPTDYNEDIADEICKLLARGHSLVKICLKLKLDYRTVLRWLDRHEEFSRNYARARDEQADYYADEIMDLADEPPQTTTNKFGATVVDSAWVSHQKNRVDARKWIASKLKPKKYGDKVQVENTGKVVIAEETDEEIAARFATKQNGG